MGRKRQVEADYRLGETRRRWLLASLQRFEALDRVRQQPDVQVESDRRHMTALLGTQEVSGAPDLEVMQGNLKACAELRRLEDCLQPPLRRLGQRMAALVKEIGV